MGQTQKTFTQRVRVSIKPNEKEVVFRDLKVVNLRIKAIVTEVLRFWHGKDGGFV